MLADILSSLNSFREARRRLFTSHLCFEVIALGLKPTQIV